MDSRPTDPVAPPAIAERLARADQLYQTGDLDAAVHLYRQVVSELDSAHPSAAGVDPPPSERTRAHAHSRIGAVLAQQGELDAAETELELAIAVDPTLPSAYSNLGNVHYGRGNFEAALAQYETAARLDPDTPTYLHNQHAAFKKLGRLDRAVSVMKRAHTLERQVARRDARDRWRQTRQRTGCVLPVLFLGVAATVLGAIVAG